VKEFLSRGGHQFRVRNVDEDSSAYDELVALGWRAVPMTIIGPHVIKGFDPKALQDALNATT
jgi:glutaredoxin